MFFQETLKLESDTLATKSGSRTKWTLEEEEALDPNILERMRPEVRARRAKYARYAAGLCAFCALLAIAALVKMMLQ
jgi:hypothetical protein